MIAEYIVLYKYYGRNRKLNKVFYNSKEYSSYKNWIISQRGYTNVRFLKKENKNKDEIKLEIKKNTKSTKDKLLNKLLSEKRDLKFHKFIYALINDEEVVYIGQTNNMQSRINTHRRDKTKEFTHFSIVSKLPNEIDKKGLDKLEEKYIKMFKPKYNVSHNAAKRELVSD